MTVPVVVAAVLAGLGGLVTAVGALGDVSVLRHGYSAGLQDLYFVRPRGWLRMYYWAAVVVEPGAAILLFGGAVLLLVRRGWGRGALTVGCAAVVALGVFGAAVKPDLLGAGTAGVVDRVVYLAPLVFPVAVVVLAWWPAGRRGRPVVLR